MCDIDVVIVRAYPLQAWEPPAEADAGPSDDSSADVAARGVYRPPLAERARLRVCHDAWASAFRRLEAEFETAYEEQMARLFEESQMECAAGTQAGFMFEMQQQQLSESMRREFAKRCEAEYKAVYGARAQYVPEPGEDGGGRRTSAASAPDKDVFTARAGNDGRGTTTGVSYIATYLVADAKYWLARSAAARPSNEDDVRRHLAVLRVWDIPPDDHPLATVDGNGATRADARRATTRATASRCGSSTAAKNCECARHFRSWHEDSVEKRSRLCTRRHACRDAACASAAVPPRENNG